MVKKFGDERLSFIRMRFNFSFYLCLGFLQIVVVRESLMSSVSLKYYLVLLIMH